MRNCGLAIDVVLFVKKMGYSEVGLNDSCVVRLQQMQNETGRFFQPGSGDGRQAQPEYSCSGIVIDSQKGLVLTSGQVFSEAVKWGARGPGLRRASAAGKWNISAGRLTENYAYYTTKEDMKSICIDVILPERVQPHLLPTSSTIPVHKNVSQFRSSECGTRTLTAELVILWKCQEFDQILKTIVPEKDGWKFTENEEGGGKKSNQFEHSGQRSDSERDSAVGQCVEPFGLSSVSRNLPVENCISWFALLKLLDDRFTSSRQCYDPFNSIRTSTLLDGLLVQQGDPVCLRTTPFGATCPSVFLNSVSKGIVSNMAGPRHQLIMTDARCIPGSEGGGMYVTRAGDGLQDSMLAGIIVAPLCWKNNEWIGLTLVCSIQAVVESLRLITDAPSTKRITQGPAFRRSSESSRASLPSVVQRCMRSVVLIKVGSVWGSGVMVSTGRGVILTCRHVVHKATDRHVRVRIDSPYMHWEDATIIYTTGQNSPFDLAVLKLEGGFGAVTKASGGAGKRMAESYTQGQPVITVGHALLAPELDLSPSVSIGVMSKVTTVNNTPVMLQSTCAVHAGSSGGALFCPRTGQLLGIVTSNARDVDSGASFPHVNFSIPWTFIAPILTEYLQTDDVRTLESLDADDDHLVAIWSLDDKGIAEKEQRLLSLSKL